jgi:hypothetical protein
MDTQSMTVRIDDILYRNPRDAAHPMARDLLADADARMELAEQLRQRRDLGFKPLGSLLLGLDGAIEPTPPDRDIRLRSSNVLRRVQVITWSRLASCSVFEIECFPNCGTKTVRDILATAILGWAELSEVTPANGHSGDRSIAGGLAVAGPGPTHSALASSDSHEEARPTRLPDLEDVLRCLWLATGAETVDEALEDFAADRLPASLGERISILGRLRLEQVFDLPTVDERTWATLLALPSRQRQIMELRVYAPRGMRATLDELGRRFDVSGSRIQQLESSVIETLAKRLEGSEGAAFRHLGRRAARQLGDATTRDTVDTVLTRLVEATSDGESNELGIRKAVLRELAGPLSEVGGVVVSARGLRRLKDLESRYSGAAPGEMLDRAAFDATIADLGADDPTRESILVHLGLRQLNGGLVAWRGSMSDMTVSSLAAYGRPMSLDEIHGELGYHRNPRSVAGHVRADERILRRGKDRYGLRQWGGEEYRGILDAIERVITDAGGSIGATDLVARVTTRFGVSENSLRAYSGDRRFIRREDGAIAMRAPDDPEAPIGGRPIDVTRGAFLLDGVWHYRVEVNPEAIRGSGRVIPRSIALEAGIEPDLTLGFDYDGGTVVFNWSGPQPTLGSVRNVLSAHSCVESDLLFISLGGPEPRSVRVGRSAARNAEFTIRRLALEMGLQPGDVSQDDPIAVASALGLPPGADWEDVADRLRARGEMDLVTHVPEGC